MTDPDLIERVASGFINTPCGPSTCPEPCLMEASHNWEAMDPMDRTYWRSVVAALITLIDADRTRPPHVGTLTPAQLADLDPHDRQAREATEQ